MASTPVLWRTLDLSGHQTLAGLLLKLPKIQLYKQNLRDVKLEFTAGVRDEHIKALQTLNLEAVNLNGCQQ